MTFTSEDRPIGSGYEPEDGQHMLSPIFKAKDNSEWHWNKGRAEMVRVSQSQPCGDRESAAAPDAAALVEALSRARYLHSGKHLAGFRLCVGFETMKDAGDAHEAIAKAVIAMTPPADHSASDGAPMRQDGLRVSKTLQQRLAARIVVDPSTGCHVWIGSKVFGGYGIMRKLPGRKSIRVHRVAYELANGLIPAGLVIDHLCRNRLCCNPEHLEAVTPRVNNLRGVGAAAQQARKTHCNRGHPFDSENTRITPAGSRRCRKCHIIQQAVGRARRKAR